MWRVTLSNPYFFAGHDCDESSSVVEEQCQEIEQEHHPEWFKPCCPCGVLCARFFLSGVLLFKVLLGDEG